MRLHRRYSVYSGIVQLRPEDTTEPQVEYNNYKGKVSSIRIDTGMYTEVNGVVPDAMFSVVASLTDPTNKGGMISVFMSLPITYSTDVTPAGQQLKNLVNGMKREGFGRNTTDLGMTLDMNGIFPSQKPFYRMFDKKRQNNNTIVFEMADSIPASGDTLLSLHKILLGSKASKYTNYEQIQAERNLAVKKDGTKMKKSPNTVISYNSQGANLLVRGDDGKPIGARAMNNRGGVRGKGNDYVGGDGGDIYIDCQPVNTDEEEANVKMKGYKLQSDFDLFSREKIKKFFLNPWVQGFILFLVMLLLFYVTKMLMAKGKTAGKAKLEVSGG